MYSKGAKVLVLIFLVTSLAIISLGHVNAATGSLKVNAGQPEVSLSVGNFSGSTDSWNEKQVDGLAEGTYSLKLTKAGYKDWVKQVSITSGKTTMVYASLELGSGVSVTRSETISYNSPLGTLDVHTGMDGVNVYLGGEYGGTADNWNGRTVEGLVDGSYTLKLSKPGYKDWMKQVIITVSKTTTVYAALESGTGKATTRSETITFDSPFGSLKVQSDWANQGTSMYVGDEYAGTVDVFGSKQVDGLIVGAYTLRLERIGFKTWTKQVSITVGQTTTVYAYLESGTGSSTTRQETISYNSAFGSLNVHANQSDVNVYVGGEYGGTTDTWGDRTVDGIVEGKYTVTLTKTGFRDVTKEVTINAGQQAKILAELVSDPLQQKSSPTQPSAVQLSTGATGQYTVQLSWSQNVDTGFSSYEIYMSTSIGTLGNSVANILSQSTTSYEVNGLNPSTTYYFTVRVWNIVNEFSDSNQVTIATLANDGAPSFALDNSTLIFGIVLVAVVVPVVSAVAVYRRKSNSKADYSKVFAHAERDRLERERAARERVERERVERERRRAEEEREREERQRAEEKWRQNHHNNSYDPFAVLGVPKGATSTQVKAAWRELCKTWHPDMIQGDARVKQMANEKFRSINEAYDEIKRMKGWT